MPRRIRSTQHTRPMSNDHEGGMPARIEHDFGTPSRVEAVIQTAISSGEIVSIGVLNLVRSTLVAVLSGAREVGAEIAIAGVAAVRGAIRAAADIGGDVGLVAKQAVRGSIQAADEIGGDLGHVARSGRKSVGEGKGRGARGG